MADDRLKYIFELMAQDGVSVTLNKIGEEAKKTKKEVGGIGSFIDNFKKNSPSITAIATSFTAVTGAVGILKSSLGGAIDVINSCIDAAAEQEAANNRLNTALKLSGQYSEENAQRFQDLASSLQKTTTIADDAALGAASLALSYGATAEQAEQIVKVAADMSAALGVDLDTAVTQLSGTLNGSIGKLGKVNSELKDLTPEAIKSGGALSILGKQFDGAAAKNAETYAGSVAKLKNAFGEVLETLGGLIVKSPLVIKSMQAVAEAFEGIASRYGDAGSPEKNRLKEIELGINGLNKLIVASGSARGKEIYGAKIAKLEVEKAAIEKALAEKKAIRDIATTHKEAEDQKQLKSKETTDKFLENQKNFKASYDTLSKSLENVGLNPTQVAQNNADKERDVLNNAFKLKLVDRDKFNQELKKIDIKLFKELDIEKQKDRDKETQDYKEQLERESSIRKQQKEMDDEREKREKSMADNIGTALGGLRQGAQGVGSLVTAGLSQSMGPLGGALGQGLDFLSQGPEAVKAQVKAFAEGVPQFIQAIVESVPVLIETLVTEAPKLIFALIEKLPVLISSLITSIPRIITAFITEIPRIAIEFAIGFVKMIPHIIGSLISGIWNGLADMFDNLVNWLLNMIGFGDGGFFSGLFAEGGKVPGGFENDNFKAGLTSGEMVIDRTNTNRLENFLLNQSSGSGMSGNSEAMLTKIAGLLEQEQTIYTDVKLQDEAFAKIQIKLSRTGARVA